MFNHNNSSIYTFISLHFTVVVVVIISLSIVFSTSWSSLHQQQTDHQIYDVYREYHKNQDEEEFVVRQIVIFLYSDWVKKIQRFQTLQRHRERETIWISFSLARFVICVFQNNDNICYKVTINNNKMRLTIIIIRHSLILLHYI